GEHGRRGDRRTRLRPAGPAGPRVAHGPPYDTAAETGRRRLGPAKEWSGMADRRLTIPEGGFWPAPQVPQPNIYPRDGRVGTAKLAAIYEKSKRAVWNPADLPWDALRPGDFTAEQRLAIMYWFAVLANFDASGPAVFARATVQAFEKHEEDPV